MKITLSFFILFCSLTNQAQTVVNRSFATRVSESCAETTTGGCMKYTYCTLSFEKDSVVVIYTLDSYCISSDTNQNHTTKGFILTQKKYAWKAVNNIISINGFNTYKTYTIVGDNDLLAKKEMNYEWVDLYFTAVVK
jgi:hypothetical protein